MSNAAQVVSALLDNDQVRRLWRAGLPRNEPVREVTDFIKSKGWKLLKAEQVDKSPGVAGGGIWRFDLEPRPAAPPTAFMEIVLAIRRAFNKRHYKVSIEKQGVAGKATKIIIVYAYGVTTESEQARRLIRAGLPRGAPAVELKKQLEARGWNVMRVTYTPSDTMDDYVVHFRNQPIGRLSRRCGRAIEKKLKATITELFPNLPVEIHWRWDALGCTADVCVWHRRNWPDWMKQ